MNTKKLWETDDGIRYLSYEKRRLSLFRKLFKKKKAVMVKTTPYALGNGVVKKHEFGVLMGFGKGEGLIYVQKIGRKSKSSYWCGFWRPLNEKESVELTHEITGGLV